MTDRELILKYLKTKDEKLIATLFGAYIKDIFNYILSISKDKQLAEDITQDTIIKSWKKLHAFDTDLKFKPWLLSIARNTALDYFKKRKELPMSAFEDEEGDNIFDNLPDTAVLQDEMFARVEDAKSLQTIVETLPEKYKEIIFLYYRQGMNLEEIAEMLNKSVNTVKSIHRRAIILLREKIFAPKT